MTVSFTKKEVEWLFNFISVGTEGLYDLKDEGDEYAVEALDVASKIRNKLRIAQVK